MRLVSHSLLLETLSAKQALQLTWRSLFYCGTKFKQATGSDVVPYIHDKHHEHTLCLAQKHPGCASGNHLEESSTTDTAICYSLPWFIYPLSPLFYYLLYPPYLKLWICNTTVPCVVAVHLLAVQIHVHCSKSAKGYSIACTISHPKK